MDQVLHALNEMNDGKEGLELKGLKKGKEEELAETVEELRDASLTGMKRKRENGEELGRKREKIRAIGAGIVWGG